MRFCEHKKKGTDLYKVMMKIDTFTAYKGAVTSDGLNPYAVDFLCKLWTSDASSPNPSSQIAEHFVVLFQKKKRILIVRYRDPVDCDEQGVSSRYKTFIFELKRKEWTLTDSYLGAMKDDK